MSARTSGSAPRSKPAVEAVFGGLLALALSAALLPWFPGSNRFEAGAVVTDTVVAARSVSYVSDVLTEERRIEAAEAVDDVWVFDPTVAGTQLGALGRRLDRIEVARNDEAQSDSARVSAIRAASDGSLSERGAEALAAASALEWTELKRQVEQVLSRILAGALDGDGLQAARLRAAGLLSSQLTADQSLALTELLDALIVPTLTVDSERTNALRAEAIAAQPPVRVSIARGEIVATEGSVLDGAAIERLDELGLRGEAVRWEHAAAAGVLAALLGVLAGTYVGLVRPASLSSARRLALFGLLLAVPVLAAKLGLPATLPDDERRFFAYAIPFSASSIAAAVLLDAGAAVLLTLLLLLSTVFVAVSMPGNGGQLGLLELVRLVLVVTGSSLAGLLVAVRADRLQRYLFAGLAAAAAAEVALVTTWLLDADRRPVDLLWMSGASLVGGLLAATIAVGTFILLSRPFGIVTRVELMELSQLSHPLLRRLQDEAPGTFQHSVLVGNLAERAADRIGADPLLTRVGAYYHDIGKLVAPAFFVENAPPGESPHDGLDPLQSTRVIHQHVTAGVEIARKEGIPAAVVQFIPQHHGTRMASFFYRRAAETDPGVEPGLFRYPGPKPQSREAALVMLADAAEASVRATVDHSAERIRAVVEGVIRERIEEGQFTECDISLRDLAAVGQSFTTALTAVYHPRIEYPAPTERERAERSLDGDLDRDGDAAVQGEAVATPRRPRLRAPRPSTLARERGEDDA